MSKKLKPIPHFRSEAEEREFWESHDTADYYDLSKAQRARFPNLKLSPAVGASDKPRKESGRGSD
jgi:CopG antitoxin of type II toxin-antitoxin system